MSPLPNRPLQPPQPPSSQQSQPDEWATNVQTGAIDSSHAPEPSNSSDTPPVARPPLMRPIARPSAPPEVSEPKKPEPVAAAPEPTVPAVTADVAAPTQAELDGLRQQPIPAPSEPMQYRAIGLLRGRYKAEDEQFTRGTLTTTDGTDIQAVLLGRVMSLVRNHLDLEQDHLWVVYPRTREKEQDLHAQIVGVWEPEKLNKPDEETGEEEPSISYQPSSEVDDDYFSIRGEVIFQSPEDNSIVVKIQQAPRKKDGDRIKSFKLKLEGSLTGKVVGYFWDLQVRRQGDNLVIHQSSPIGMIPPKKRSKSSFDRGGDRPRRDFAPRPGGGSFNRSPKPTPNAAASSPAPVRKDPLPKPVKKQNPVTEG